MSERVLITFEVDATGAIKQVDNVKRKIKEIPAATKQADAGMKGLASSMAKIGGAAVIAATAMRGLRAGIRFVGDSIEASAAQERVFTQLETSVNRVGASYKALEPILASHFARIQKNTRFGDDASAKAMQQLIDTVGNVKTAYKLLEPTMDLAVAKDMALENAVKLVGMAAMGQVGTLSRYGIILDDTQRKFLATASAAERAEMILALLNDKFGGAAAADMATYGGQVEGVSNAFGDLQEAVGDLFTGVAESSGILEDMVAGLEAAAMGVHVFELGLRSIGQIGDEVKLLSVEDTIKRLGAAIAELDNSGRDKQSWWEGGQTRKELVQELKAAILEQERLNATVRASGDRIAELTGIVSGNTGAVEDNEEAWSQTGGSINDTGKAVVKVAKDFGDAQRNGLLFAKTMKDGKGSVSLFENATATLGDTIGFELNPAVQAFIADLIEARREAEKTTTPLKKLETVTAQTAETMRETFSDLLNKGLAGELESFGDLWRTIWGNLAVDAVGMIGDAFSDALDEGGTVTGVVARFADNFWTSLSEGSTGEQVGTLVSGVGGVINAAQGQGGVMGGIQGAMSGAMSAMSIGALYGSAFPVVGTIIGAVIGGVIGWLGSRQKEKKPSSTGYLDFGTGRNIVHTQNQGLTHSQELAWANERRVQFQGQVAAMTDVLRIFNDSGLFDLIDDTALRFNFSGNSTLDELSTLFTESVLPDLMESMFRDALTQGFSNMGVSRGAFDEMWEEIGIMDAGEQVEALRNYVTALVGTANMMENMDWENITREVDANSMEAFGMGFNMMMDQINQAMLGLDDMTFQERANMANQVNDLILTARQAEIQMLQQINQIQDSINASIDSMLEDIMLGGMEPAGQSSYFLDNITRLMDDLAAGTGSPEELANLMGELMRYLSEYRNVMGENFYVAGDDGIVPADWITKILEAARAMANEQSEGFREDIRDMNQSILDQLVLIYEALTMTTAERQGLDIAVTVTVDASPDFLVAVRTDVRDYIDTRLDPDRFFIGSVT